MFSPGPIFASFSTFGKIANFVTILCNLWEKESRIGIHISSQKCERYSYPIQIFSPNRGKIITFSIFQVFCGGGGGGGAIAVVTEKDDDFHCYYGDNDWGLLLSIRNVSYGLEECELRTRG
jgi:hypothetical protein